ncbi:hypothetical protein IGI04_024117 [Brassica rapa subsp. trilocularis]|uniref:Replication protein A 70 kDa DNA-binding subunit B/D first OB fold domain-containing protein n=1 Tax=Brassica rapa subsp. trilocularis TaxID=1813537 RepID=A0ABQ7M965_BRACM|nr:hypothetical protein IGI04_024117 [Brassica rapa subsp. trilocularis]
MASESYLTLDQLNKKCPYRRTEYENTIQGCVHPSLIEKFGDGLHEGAIIEICKFNLQDYNKNYKISYHKFQIRLTERTTIACVEQKLPQTPPEKFQFRNYEEFAQLKDSTYDLYDVIGCIKNIEKTDVRSKTTPVLRRQHYGLNKQNYLKINIAL